MRHLGESEKISVAPRFLAVFPLAWAWAWAWVSLLL